MILVSASKQIASVYSWNRGTIYIIIITIIIIIIIIITLATTT